MLDLQKIQAIAATATPQELYAVLLWQTRFNDCDGPTILTDLIEQPHLWKSFIFSRPVYGLDPKGLSFLGMVDTLMAMANYFETSEDSPIQCIRYPADMLFVLAENQDEIVSGLLDLGKKWQADDVIVYSADQVQEVAQEIEQAEGEISNEDDNRWFLNHVLGSNLERIYLNAFNQSIEGVIITYWWD